MSSIFEKNEFAIETVASGRFTDEDAGKHYVGEVAVIRLNHIALDERLDFALRPDQGDFDTYEEWQECNKECDAKKDAFNEKVKGLLGWNDRDASFSLTRNIAEIFTAVRIWEREEADDDDTD